MRLLLADDHPLLLDGLRHILSDLPDTTLLPSVSNGRQLLDVLHYQAVDLVILDLNMPGVDGLTALRQIRHQFPAIRVIVFTSYHQTTYIREAKALGAAGYLLKTTDAGTLKAVIQAVAGGQEWFPAVPTGAGTAAPIPADDAFLQKYQLTRRETDIIRLIAAGLTTRQISGQLFISEFTVNAHRRNIARKTGTDTPVALLNFAREQGITGD